ncbi:MAG: hypothetical protein A2383_02560 [Candidatus Pacebacteria bacterium RIFOXYB1_FULL_39_46]|nr:MAG: hypothetical protein A2383_02560 [Candidatus Pacebacteria bacterium RIFOXYB1_FULL_39_46]OGJ39269.1 MAG: hypothetical protein A2182_02825 [Candidatus Pacebacteria bacterium RIFOXYA1_FULL_38_18]OGJ40948.1 MAG: hypothetical protein A2582_01490 [Candidatus Pacebacteria bacterium RIFOXYD1_FULL_39_27]OGJ41130.1 MAG: hypothetical protein A2411_01405 [Candidatus Pacebacteria bacterium RIFOXYC1_FULL_39_21]
MKKILIFLGLVFLLFLVLKTFKNNSGEPVSQPMDENEKLQEVVDSSVEVVEKAKKAILDEDIDFLVEETTTFDFECEQELMGNKPGENVEECKTQDYFVAYPIGIIEANGTVVPERQYREFLKSLFDQNNFEFSKEYKEGDFLYLGEGYSLGFLDKEQGVFLLVEINQDGKIVLAYQTNQDLFEDYLR